MTITITLNSRFKTLNDGNLAIKANAGSREREAVVDITYSADQNYVTNGNTLDFSAIRKFIKVYSCEIIEKSFGRVMTFVPAAEDASATGKLKIFHTDGTELSNGNTGTQSMTLKAIIRGN